MNNNLNIFKCFIYSITSFDKYKYLLRQSMGKAVGYLILLALLLSVAVYVPSYFVANDAVDEVASYITEKIPDFKLTDGKLEIDAKMPIIIDESGDVPIVIDTTPGAEDRLINQYDSVMLITSDKIIQKNYVNRQDIPLSMYQGVDMTSDDLIEMLPLVKPFLIFVFIFVGIFFVIGKFIAALVVSIVGTIANSSRKTNLTYQSIFKLSIYSMTLPLIVGSVINALSINVPFLWILFYIGSGIYVFGAISSIKKDIEASGDDSYGYYGGDTFKRSNYRNDDFGAGRGQNLPYGQYSNGNKDGGNRETGADNNANGENNSNDSNKK